MGLTALEFKTEVQYFMNLLNQTKDFVAIICFYILSLYIYSVAIHYPVNSGIPKAQNPGFYPMLLSGLLFLLSTIYLIQMINKLASKKSQKNKDKAEVDLVLKDEEEKFWGQSTLQTKIYLGISIIMLFVYIYLLNWLGFASATFIFLVVISRMLASIEKKISRIIMYSLFITFIMFVIFDIFVRVRFPKGILF
jgi:putative tricarboxylic transport membrane protein